MKRGKLLLETHEKIDNHIVGSDGHLVGSKIISKATFFFDIFKDIFGTFGVCLELKTHPQQEI